MAAEVFNGRADHLSVLAPARSARARSGSAASGNSTTTPLGNSTRTIEDPDAMRTGTSPDFSPGFGILGRSGKADWPIVRRGIAVAMSQGGSAKMQSQSGPRAE